MNIHDEKKCRKVKFCSKCSKCPELEFTGNSVKIGEKDNICTLTLDQWKDLKQIILSGKV